MRPISRTITIAALTVVLLLSGLFMNVTSQPTDQIQPHFSQAIAQVHKAESAGATTDEIANLVTLLNKALELDEHAIALTRPEDASMRAQLLRQVDAILANVQSNAAQLEAVALQRTLTNNLITYISGCVAAFIATFAYAFGVYFWRKYRVKRAFEMRLIPK
jgi:hypothetical protein